MEKCLRVLKVSSNKRIRIWSRTLFFVLFFWVVQVVEMEWWEVGGRIFKKKNLWTPELCRMFNFRYDIWNESLNLGFYCFVDSLGPLNYSILTSYPIFAYFDLFELRAIGLHTGKWFFRTFGKKNICKKT